MNEIVCKIEHDVEMDKVCLTPYQRPRVDEPNRFEIFLNAQHMEGMENRANVGTNSPTWDYFSIASDEGTAIGGKNSAPAPLDYLAAGIAFCFLSHVTMYCRACNIKLKKASVELRMKFSIINKAEQMEFGWGGSSDGLEFHCVVVSEESEESIRKVYEECTKACVAIQSIVNPVPFDAHLHLNGIELT